MAHSANYLAIDLGAESGRTVVGSFDGERLRLRETHRFPNGPVRLAGRLHWDVLRLYGEILTGVRASLAEAGCLKSLGLDTWGVDFALLGKGDVLLANPYHYRDPHTDGVYNKAFALVPREDIFAQTGCQFMQINTVFQLLALRLAGSPLMGAAETMLMIPNLFLFWLTGAKGNEFTNAATTQAYNPITRDWAWDLLDGLGIPRRIFPAILPPGTPLGPLRDDVREECGAGDLPVIATATHDTAAAVAAVPASAGHSVYLSSGTWSIIGVESGEPVMTEAVLRDSFSNEGGAAGDFRLARNVTGLWLIQELRREWARGGEELSYAEITDLAARARPFTGILDPDDPSFLPPGDMEPRIRAFCERTGQLGPGTKGEFARAATESLALKYRWNVERLGEITGRRPEVIHIVGGGSRNRLLSQFTADAAQVPVVAGPVETTAVGNVLVQMRTMGEIASLAEGREVVRNSFELERFEPGDAGPWDEAYAEFLRHPAG